MLFGVAGQNILCQTLHNLLTRGDSTHTGVTQYCSFTVLENYKHTRANLVMHTNKVSLVKRSISFPPQLRFVRLQLPFIPNKGGSRGRGINYLDQQLASLYCATSWTRLQDQMLGLRKYVGVSGLTASAVIYHAFYTREQ